MSKKEPKQPLPEGFFLVDKLLDKRKVGTRVEYFVTWQGYPLSAATWEPRASLMETCPHVIKEFEDELKAKQKKQTEADSTNEMASKSSERISEPTAASPATVSPATSSGLSSSAPKRGRAAAAAAQKALRESNKDAMDADSTSSSKGQKRSSPLRSSSTPAATEPSEAQPRKRGRPPKKIQPVLISESAAPASSAFALASAESASPSASTTSSSAPATSSPNTIAGILGTSVPSVTSASSAATSSTSPSTANVSTSSTSSSHTFAKPAAPASSSSSSSTPHTKHHLLADHILKQTQHPEHNNTNSSAATWPLPKPHAGGGTLNSSPPSGTSKSPVKPHLIQSLLRPKPQERIDTLFAAPPLELPLNQNNVNPTATSVSSATTGSAASDAQNRGGLVTSKTIEDLMTTVHTISLPLGGNSNTGHIGTSGMASVTSNSNSTPSTISALPSHPLHNVNTLSPKKRNLLPQTPPKLEKNERLLQKLKEKNSEYEKSATSVSQSASSSVGTSKNQSSPASSAAIAIPALPLPVLANDEFVTADDTKPHAQAPHMFSGMLDLLHKKGNATTTGLTPSGSTVSTSGSSTSGNSAAVLGTSPPTSPLVNRLAKKKKDEFVEIVSDSPQRPKFLTPSQREERQRNSGGISALFSDVGLSQSSQGGLDWGLSQDNNNSLMGLPDKESGNNGTLENDNNNGSEVASLSSSAAKKSGPVLTWDNSNDRRALTGSNSSSNDNSSGDLLTKIKDFEESINGSTLSSEQQRLASQKLKALLEKLERKSSV